jgi:hypothetical protein
LGNVAFRQVLEERIAAGTEEIAEGVLQHAKELRRRDMVEEETADPDANEQAG